MKPLVMTPGLIPCPRIRHGNPAMSNMEVNSVFLCPWPFDASMGSDALTRSLSNASLLLAPCKEYVIVFLPRLPLGAMAHLEYAECPESSPILNLSPLPFTQVQSAARRGARSLLAYNQKICKARFDSSRVRLPKPQTQVEMNTAAFGLAERLGCISISASG